MVIIDLAQILGFLGAQSIKYIYIYIYIYVGSQIVAHTLTETGNGPNRPNTINL